MHCDDFQILLHGDLDGELSSAEAAYLSGHLADCEACQRVRDRQLTLRAAVQKHAAGQFAMPKAFPIRILAALPAERAAPSLPLPPFPRRWVAFGTALASVAALAAGLTYFLAAPGQDERFFDEAIAGHERSLLANHLTDIASADPATVLAWFRDKLDFVPPVKDVSAQGFNLVGGRLDFLYDRELAALVYRRDTALVNVFVWPAETLPKAVPQQFFDEGFSLVLWAEAGVNYCAVAKLNQTELAEFVRVYRSKAI
ncbi:MAG: zf-HC2 domain-containing protein [Candidatus Competibacteraceae bacterium]|nr:zf-HC2 domain-containing protein [Candidatus Competibacteraceae bacterium]MBK9953516.1 zf-HC2 domain-containing protein [Candidatus Competibacteraceae bacterium]